MTDKNWIMMHPNETIQFGIMLILFLTLVINIILIINQKNQYIIDNRPQIFVSGWGDFNKYEGYQTIRMNLFNSGKLPAKIEKINQKIEIGSDGFSDDFIKPVYLFPNQNNMFLDLKISNELMNKIIQNRGFILKVSFDYYSLSDGDKKNRFYYYTEYEFPLNLTKSMNRFQDPILRGINAG